MKNFKAAAISTIITEVFVVFLTLYSEMSEGFKKILTIMTGHHWASKSLLSVIMFFLLYFVFSKVKSNEKDVWKYTKWVFLVTIICMLIILGFFIFEFFE